MSAAGCHTRNKEVVIQYRTEIIKVTSGLTITEPGDGKLMILLDFDIEKQVNERNQSQNEAIVPGDSQHEIQIDFCTNTVNVLFSINLSFYFLPMNRIFCCGNVVLRQKYFD